MTGDETLQLSVGGATSDAVGIRGVADCGEGAIKDVDGDGICRPDQKTAVYTYTVDVDANYSGRQDYAYEFVGDKGGFEQDFDLVSTQVVVTDPGDGSGTVDVKDSSQGGLSGEIVVGKGVKQFEVTVILAADQKELITEMRRCS